MLCLTDEIVGNNPGVCRVVSNDADFSWTRDLVYSHPAKQLSLGLGHKLVPRTHDDIRLGPSEQTEGEGCNTLQVKSQDTDRFVEVR